MAPVLTNRGRFDAETLRAAYRRLWRPRFWLMLVLGLLFLGSAVWLTILYTVVYVPDLHMILCLVFIYFCGAFYFWYAFSTVNRSVKRTIRRLEETRQVSGYDTCFRFLDEELQFEASISADVQHLSYSNVRRVLSCQNLLLLRSRSRQFLLLDRNGFENGTEADFWKLMSEKCPRAVPKKYRA